MFTTIYGSNSGLEKKTACCKSQYVDMYIKMIVIIRMPWPIEGKRRSTDCGYYSFNQSCYFSIWQLFKLLSNGLLH